MLVILRTTPGFSSSFKEFLPVADGGEVLLV